MSQEKVCNLLAVDGDCYCNSFKYLGMYDFNPLIHRYKCVKCQKEFKSLSTCSRKALILEVNLDLTAEAGAFWLMKRLPKWDRFEEFCEQQMAPAAEQLKIEMCERGLMVNELPKRVMGTVITHFGSDPSALYKAICEFEGLEVEG